MNLISKFLPGIKTKQIKPNSLQRRIGKWVAGQVESGAYTSPFDGVAMLKDLGMECTRENCYKAYNAIWRLSHREGWRYSPKDFTFPKKGWDKFDGLLTDIKVNDEMKGETVFEKLAKTQVNPDNDPFTILQDCYNQLVTLSKEERTKVIQSLTIML